MTMNDHRRIAIVPGSFDPITKGHVNIVERAAEEYDTVYVAVMINESKSYMFSLSEREEIARACFEGRDNIRVISSSGWLWELANDLDACAIVKGYRNDTDLEYEKKMAEFNDARCPKAKTVLLRSDDALVDVSSTMVREQLLSNAEINSYLPPRALEAIEAILKRRSL